MSGSPATERYSADIDDFEVGDAKVQHFGVLMKKPFGHKSARWQRRCVGWYCYKYRVVGGVVALSGLRAV